MTPEERAALPSFESPLVDEEKAAIARFAAIALEIASNAQIMVDMGRIGTARVLGDIVEAAADIYKLAEECQTLWYTTWGAGDAPVWSDHDFIKGYDRPFMYREFGERE